MKGNGWVCLGNVDMVGWGYLGKGKGSGEHVYRIREDMGKDI